MHRTVSMFAALQIYLERRITLLFRLIGIHLATCDTRSSHVYRSAKSEPCRTILAQQAVHR